MTDKFQFYEEYGVEEYYIFDPDHKKLAGYRRKDGKLRKIPKMNGWVSPRLGVRFDISEPNLQLFGPDGQRFLTLVESDKERRQVAIERDAERRRTDQIASERDAERSAPSKSPANATRMRSSTNTWRLCFAAWGSSRRRRHRGDSHSLTHGGDWGSPSSLSTFA